jgi:hypothetical protein
LEEDYEVEGWAVALTDGGTSTPGTAYEFRLLLDDAAAYAAGTMAELTTGAADRLLAVTPAADNEPVARSVKALTLTALKDQYLGLEVLNGDSGNPGRSLTWTVWLRRKT